jgi:D-tyrosyl-tRNA(Tyr) deacylase
VSGRIGKGFVLLVGFTHGDSEEQLKWMTDKVVGLRVFTDAEDKMNLALGDVQGSVLVVSQFTLYGDASKGRRRSSTRRAPELAIRCTSACQQRPGTRWRPGEFGATMEVELVNDGPVTIMLER